jgi:hypothetical protein
MKKLILVAYEYSKQQAFVPNLLEVDTREKMAS